MEELYMIALSMVPGIGSIGSKRIMEYAGSAESVFKFKKADLQKISGIGPLLAERILNKNLIGDARRELEYINNNEIECLFYYEDSYPERLKFCEDAPLVLYARKNLSLDGKKILSVVGTRRPSRRGLDNCRKLVQDLAERHPDLVIVSGLAYGIDHCAHKTALDSGIETVAVLGHGLNFMYPAAHRKIASKIEFSGALLTDFPSGERPLKNNFIKRNRIIGGLSEATVVVESGSKGGALITADLANSYHREVFAFPGHSEDPSSAGCNRLIKTHKASLIEDYRDLEYMLGWETNQARQHENRESPIYDCTPQERKILEVLEAEGESSIDLIYFRTGLPLCIISEVLLNLEFQGLIKAIPGDYFRLLRPLRIHPGVS